MTEAVETALADYLAGDTPANVALMHLIFALPTRRAVQDCIEKAHRQASRSRDALMLGRLLSLEAEHPQAFETVKQVIAEADHAASSDAASARWTDVFDGLARKMPNAAVALYTLGSQDLLARATQDVVTLMQDWNLLDPSYRLLDLGCGNGRFAAPLSARVRAYVGIDPSQEMIRHAADAAAHLPNVEFHTGGSEDLASVGEPCFDIVLAADVFPYIVLAGDDATKRSLEEIGRILLPGGTLIVLNFSYRRNPDENRRELEQYAARAELRLERCVKRFSSAWDAPAYLLTKTTAKAP